MFERFTTDARRVVVSAQETARDLGHPELGDEHLLLGLLQTPGVAADVLRAAGADPVVLRDVVARGDDAGEALAALGIDLDEVRRRAEAAFGPGALDQPAPRRRGRLPRLLGDAHLPLTRPARKVIEGSLVAARALGHDALHTEHLLLGLLALGDSPGNRALRRGGVVLDRQTAEAAVRDRLRRSA